MDIKAYIESGILEQYVIGTLSPADHAAVEKNILLYPELASEVESIEIALETYAKHQGRKPKLTEDQLIQNLHKTHPVSSNQAKSSVSKSSSWPTYLLGILAVGLLGYIIFQNNRVSESRQLNQRLQFTLDSLRNLCTQQPVRANPNAPFSGHHPNDYNLTTRKHPINCCRLSTTTRITHRAYPPKPSWHFQRPGHESPARTCGSRSKVRWFGADGPNQVCDP